MDVTYAEIRLMREALIDEMRTELRVIGIEALKLVEMRLQTILMAKIPNDDLQREKKNFKN